jgi:tetratricopeptide (TPR) repeat protein
MDEVDAHRWKAFFARSKWRLRHLPGRLAPVSRYFARTQVYRSERRAVLLWGTLGASCLTALIGLAALVGFGAKNVHVGAVLDSIASTVTQPAVALPIAFLLLTALAGCCRGARLGWLAWRPGPIVVADFAEFGEIEDTTSAQVTAQFRDNLSLLRLDSASPSPGAPPETSFLDVLKFGGVSSNDILSTLLSVLQASWPAHAFEVKGAIQQRDDPQRCGITLHALRVPNEPVAHVEAWASNWEQAARRAADGVVAALLPRTRVCIGPWAYWRRFRLPAELITAYREAATFERDRRYDEALSRYDDALALDPTNLTIALQQGQLQEKIGWFLAALATYQRILSLDNPGRQPVPRGVYSRPARREWRSAVAVAKYRLVVLLGQESLLREWLGEFTGEAPNYRKALRERFRGELGPLTVARGDPAADVITCAVKALIDPAHSGMTLEAARSKLMPLAYRAAFELQRSLSRWERRPWELPVSRRTLGLALAALRWRAEVAIGVPDEFDLIKEFDSAARWAGISPAFWFGWRPGAARRWTWQQHYSAACLYSIPLTRWHDQREDAREAAARAGQKPPQVDPPARAPELARRAVDRLERAAARANNEFVATRGDWVVEEDTELRGLRDCPQFHAFVTQYFPDRGRSATQPYAEEPTQGIDRRSPAHIAQTAYTRSLLCGVAVQWHELWRQRARSEERIDPHTLKHWWSEEREIWTLFGAVAKDCLDWPSRLRLLSTANELLERNGIQPVVARYGREHNGGAMAAQISAHGPPAVTGSNATSTAELLSNIEAYVLQKLAPPAGEQFEHRIGLLRRVDAQSLRLVTRAQHRRMCLLQAGVWQTFGEWLSGEREDGHLASADVLDCLRCTTRLWARAELQLDLHFHARRAAELPLVGVARIRRGRAAR